jgi:hypothetical protein
MSEGMEDMIQGRNRIENDHLQAVVNPVETNGGAFVAEMEITDVNSSLASRELASATGAVAFELMQTDMHKELGGPFQAITVTGLPVFSPSELVEFSTGGGREVPDSLHLDYGFPKYMLAAEDPNGHVQSLGLADFSHLPNSPRGSWHTDLTFMPNRPTRTTLQTFVIGKTLRPGSTPDQVRSTMVADGRWLLRELEESVSGTELALDLDALYTTELYRDCFRVEHEHLRGKPLTAPITHPRVATSPTGQRALTIHSFRNAHYATGQYLDEKVADRLDEIVDGLLASDDLPKHELLHPEAGTITVFSDRTPHYRSQAPHGETELRRVCVHDKNTYVPQFRPEDIREEEPEGWVRPASIGDLEPENYASYIRLAEQYQLGDVDVPTVIRHFKGRARKFFGSMEIMSTEYPQVNVEAELVRFAAKRGIPDIETTEDFLAFIHS